MAQAVIQRIQGYHRALLIGVIAFGLLAAAGSLHASLAGLPAPQVITAWAEWFTALLLLPFLVTFGAAVWRRGAAGPSRLTQGFVIALVVFALDLLMRAVLGLGWEPYLAG